LWKNHQNETPVLQNLQKILAISRRKTKTRAFASTPDAVKYTVQQICPKSQKLGEQSLEI